MVRGHVYDMTRVWSCKCMHVCVNLCVWCPQIVAAWCSAFVYYYNLTTVMFQWNSTVTCLSHFFLWILMALPACPLPAYVALFGITVCFNSSQDSITKSELRNNFLRMVIMEHVVDVLFWYTCRSYHLEYFTEAFYFYHIRHLWWSGVQKAQCLPSTTRKCIFAY